LLINRSTTYVLLERYEKALADLNEVLNLKPNDANIWNQMGDIWFKKRNYVKALDCFEKALELNPNLAVAQKNKDDVLKRMIK
jgi:tetratricopeptide (TPR) repeat protein